MIRTGQHGGIEIDGVPAIRCTDWMLNVNREMLDGTPIYRWAERLRPGHTASDGQGTFICDPASAAGAAFLASIRDDEPDPLVMVLLDDEATGFSFDAHVSSHVTTVAAKDATRVRISFQVTGPVTEIV